MIDDERGRVPFAVVGIVLLLGSATFAATTQPTRRPADPAVDVVVDRVSAETRTALRGAVTEGARAAARRPVVTPANTSAGRVLNASRPFRDLLRIRIYLAARDRLDGLRAQRRGVSGTASLPLTPNATALRRARERVHLLRTGENGRRLRVRVENVSVTAHRGGRTVGHETFTARFVVRSPVLALHERVDRFEERVNRGLVRPGLGRRLTGRLYALAYARGYAQYGGAPIQNVVGNRHVELMTNGALLGEQRAVFGRSDAEGRRALQHATRRVAITDLLAGSTGGSRWASALLNSGNGEPGIGPTLPGIATGNGPGPNDRMTVGPNRSVDVAYLEMVRNGGLDAVLDDVYSADVRVVARVTPISGDRPDPPDEPTGDWTLIAEDRDTRTTVENGTTPHVRPPTDWHVLTARAREVTREYTWTRTWELADGNLTRTRVTTATRRFEVDLALVGKHAPTPDAPDRPIASVHENDTGPLNGPNLARVPERAVATVFAERGDPDALARRAVDGSLDTSNLTIRAARPTGIRAWLAADLRAFRERVRNVTVSVRRGAVGGYEANPPAELAATLGANRSRLLDASSPYPYVAAKARIAARGAFLDRVLASLERRAAQRRQHGTNLGDLLERETGGSRAQLRNGLSVGRSGTADAPAPTAAEPTGERTIVDGSPSYLTLAQVSHEQVAVLPRGETVHPLAARNTNLFTVPSSDVTDAVLDGILGEKGAPLRTAALTLQAASEASENGSLGSNHTALREAVGYSVDAMELRTRETLRRASIGGSATERRAIVTDALDRWETPAARALAFANGSAGSAIADEAIERSPANATRRDTIRVFLRVRIGQALESPAGRVDGELVNRTQRATRGRVRQALDTLVGEGVDRVATRLRQRYGRPLNKTLSGLPMTPIPPGNWYATANVWQVTVRGAYTRFSVRTRRGGRTRPGSALTYVRERGAVGIDFDDDGVRERFGRNRRIQFDASTTIVVVVPPGAPGVGDVNGDMDERSAGWRWWTPRHRGLGVAGRPP